MGLAVKNKARFSVQGGAFKDPRLVSGVTIVVQLYQMKIQVYCVMFQLYPNSVDTIRSKDNQQPPFFRKSHTQV